VLQGNETRELVELGKNLGEDRLDEVLLTGPPGEVAADGLDDGWVKPLHECPGSLLVSFEDEGNPDRIIEFRSAAGASRGWRGGETVLSVSGERRDGATRTGKTVSLVPGDPEFKCQSGHDHVWLHTIMRGSLAKSAKFFW
jgi:hypothetical protein